MKLSLRKIFSFLLLLSLYVFCQDKSIESDLLKEAINKFYMAIEKGDTKTRLALFADDAIMMPPGAGIIKGKKDIAEIVEDTTYVFKIKDKEIVSMDISCSIAYTVNTYFYTYHLKGSEPVWHKTKNVHIWKKDIDGNWKLNLDIWNAAERNK
jgi:ketosteroid isomerase-like protein